jgi:transcription elongation factor Elf1
MAENQFTCKTCGETFETGVELEEHNRMMHSQYKCEICGQTFDTEKELEAHNLAMHPERPLAPKNW